MPKEQIKNYTTLRLILGDQLNLMHSWFQKKDESVCYVLMEVRSETDYVVHHIQKVAGFFAAMRAFARELKALGHDVLYLSIHDPSNLQSIDRNCTALIEQYNIQLFEYQLPDEYRVDKLLESFVSSLSIQHNVYDTEHFYTSRGELSALFKGKKQFLMETFYRQMRKKHHLLMEGDQPWFGKWNFDSENRNKIPAKHKPVLPKLFSNDLSAIHKEIKDAGIKTMGNIDPAHFVWPINRQQSLELLTFFVTECLPYFGTFQDAMVASEWSLYHSRLSFALNVKLISPKEVIDAAVAHYLANSVSISYNQLEGFVRQIIGWREYMRGIYWASMPSFASLNFFSHANALPSWYWTGKTKMNCLKECIQQSLDFSYAHHIQRLMVTGNFALLAGIDPDEVDRWYLGIYIDAIEWVEITNTRGMSQFADGGSIATKPYVSSSSYIDKMSNYCSTCFYNKSKKTGRNACPFNSLYWHFIARNESILRSNPRMSMMYAVWHKMEAKSKKELIDQAEEYMNKLEQL